ncbi:MAG: hypothetical protein NTV63_05125 [Candidatus Woesearchaeota archaeon]|nr:hypothetical protein [Candidatus Woesearchaeota archaeon]
MSIRLKGILAFLAALIILAAIALLLIPFALLWLSLAAAAFLISILIAIPGGIIIFISKKRAENRAKKSSIRVKIKDL